MAFIKISELRPAGSELFQDSESFLNELNAEEMTSSIGGQITQGFSQQSISVASQNTISGGVVSQSVGVSAAATRFRIRQ